MSRPGSLVECAFSATASRCLQSVEESSIHGRAMGTMEASGGSLVVRRMAEAPHTASGTSETDVGVQTRLSMLLQYDNGGSDNLLIVACLSAWTVRPTVW